MKDVMVISNYTDKQGNEKTFWYKVGTAFECKNGSTNFEICTMPGVKFNIQERKPKAQEEQPEEHIGPDSPEVPF